MKNLLERLSRFFMFVLRMLTEDFIPEEKKTGRKGEKRKHSAGPKGNHTYNNGEKALEREPVAGSPARNGRYTAFSPAKGKNVRADRLVIPAYLPDGGG
ncbi:MAG: hypothetical protein IJF98_07115 [Firmicutes bacterium]|nr:hypothetical protein [Bacillota bacterium]